MADGSENFSVVDADTLLELIYSKPTGRIVVVAGQSVNFWADRYLAEESALAAFRPFTSRDLDLLGSIANAYRLASEAHTKLEQPHKRKSGTSPVIANISIATGDVIRSVQFLRHVRGVTNAEIIENAVPFRRGAVTLFFADPITTLKAKLHNLVELPQEGRSDARHVGILFICVPLFLKKQLLAADETDAAARDCLRSMQRVIKLCEDHVAKQAMRSKDFIWSALFPIADIGKIKNVRLRNFREKQLMHWLNRESGAR